MIMGFVGILVDLIIMYSIVANYKQASRYHHNQSKLSVFEEEFQLLQIAVFAMNVYGLIHFTLNILFVFICLQDSEPSQTIYANTQKVLWGISLVLGSIYALIALPFTFITAWQNTDDLFNWIFIIAVLVVWVVNTGTGLLFSLYCNSLRVQ
eukprot:403333503